MSEFLELKIPINENTIRKIVALAALTDNTLDNIKDGIASEIIDEEAFDQFVSSKLQKALMKMDGIESSDEPPPPLKKSAFARAEEESASSVEDIAGHSLSGDEDSGEDESSYQVPPMPGKKARSEDDALRLPSINVPDAGENAEAFLDAAMKQSPPPASNKQRRASAAKSFNPNKVRAKVSAYTEDESAESLEDDTLEALF